MLNRESLKKLVINMKERAFALTEYVSGSDIKFLRAKLGLTQEKFAELVCSSKPTVERWERSEKVTGPIVALVKMLGENENIKDELSIPKKKGNLRLWYMFRNEVCAIIDVDERMREVYVYNYTKDIFKRPFGVCEKPDYGMYEEFIESRCFPCTRDKMKIMLEALELPFYEPIMIIQKTEGRMAEDDFWLRVE